MIKKFLSNAMLSIVMDKQAKEKYRARKASKKAKTEPAPVGVPPVMENPAMENPNVENPADSKPLSRQQLIENAMAVHKEKSKVLDELTVNDRQRLHILAMQAMKVKGDRTT